MPERVTEIEQDRADRWHAVGSPNGAPTDDTKDQDMALTHSGGSVAHQPKRPVESEVTLARRGVRLNGLPNPIPPMPRDLTVLTSLAQGPAAPTRSHQRGPGGVAAGWPRSFTWPGDLVLSGRKESRFARR